MAASPALPGLKSLHAAAASPDAKPAHPSSLREPQVVRTDVYAMPAGVGTRSIRRRITPEAGFALEILGHAIEYLADEYVHEFGRQPVAGADLSGVDPQVQAMQLLMAANRQVYYACPVVTPLYERLLKRMFPW